MGVKKVVAIFVGTSLLMWLVPLALIRAINQDAIPGFANLSSQSKSLWSGGLAVLSVNVVMAFYIVLAMREPSNAAQPSPDPAFMRRADATLSASSNVPAGPQVSSNSSNSEEVKNIKSD